MKISVMKLHAVKAYFRRDWGRNDLMNFKKIPLRAYTTLKKVYLTLFCAHLSSTFGSYLHLIWEAGGLFTLFTSVASILWLFFTPPLRVKTRVLILMIAAFSLGASAGLFTEFLFEIDQGFVFSLLAGSTIGFGNFWVGAMITRERINLFLSCLFLCYEAMLVWFALASAIFEGHTARWMIQVYVALAWYMSYFMVYSQEILYDACLGDVDFVNRTTTVLFHLPAIVVHTVRLYLVAEIEHCT